MTNNNRVNDTNTDKCTIVDQLFQPRLEFIEIKLI